MSSYQLKKGQESFQIVDGPNAGRKFERGRKYKESQIPAEVNERFEKIEVKSQKPEVRNQKSEKKTAEPGNEKEDRPSWPEQ